MAMPFTYALNHADEDIAIVAQVRLALGDTVRDDGIKPDGGNFSDDEILFVLAQHENDVERTVGAFCEMLSRHWATAADIAVGPRRENLSQVSRAWQEQARTAGSDAGKAFVATLVRSDGYSEL